MTEQEFARMDALGLSKLQQLEYMYSRVQLSFLLYPQDMTLSMARKATAREMLADGEDPRHVLSVMLHGQEERYSPILKRITRTIREKRQ